MRHDHADAARTSARANACRKWRSMDAKVRISFANIEVKRARAERIIRARLHPPFKLTVNLWLPIDHILRRGPMGPFDFSLDFINAGFIKIPPPDGHAVAHCGSTSFDMVKVSRHGIHMDITRHQAVIGPYSLR